MSKIFCFGEILLRMSPVLNRKWISEASMPVYVGGAELNVATALAKWELPVMYGTAMPDNYFSKEIIDELQAKNIDTSAIHFSGDRIGIYYLPQGADLKNAGVIYDRAHSSFASLQPGMIKWDEVLKDCNWFHFSAISPALNENAALVCKEALKAASARGIKISVDLNYRAKLWQYGKQPEDVMPELVQYCDVIMGNLWAVESLLGISSPIKSSEGKSSDELIEATGNSMLQLHKHYKKASSFAYTFRLQNDYWAVLQYGAEMTVSKKFVIDEVVDRVGSGDCFMAGLIYGLYHQHQSKDIINFAAAAAVGKLYETGDATQQTVQQVKARI
ncbi:PfkB family carbohydrate kinase [Terrimonas alba]|uniref:PfkB family carbohydrate kinase n=1 Tax=Terrimonas alba TaxID=3349636 RepID=UPI0035F4C004